MGYYTFYQLSILKDPDNQKEQFCEELNSLFDGPYADNLLNGGDELKWYNWQEDMKAISLKYPKMLLMLEGDGEEPLDIWIAHFCNGKINYREIQTYWEKFDDNEFYIQSKS